MQNNRLLYATIVSPFYALLFSSLCMAGQDPAAAAPAAGNPPNVLENIKNGVPFPDDNGSVVGDHLTLRTNVYGFKRPHDGTDTRYCAAKDSQFVVNKDHYVSFFTVPTEYDRNSANSKVLATEICPSGKMVMLDTPYIADEQTQKAMIYKRTGFAFGTLVVPFKFRLGSEKKLVASSTIAPYLGFRWRGLQALSMDLMPVASAGLAIVPVHNSETDKDETKAGLSTALGLTLKSSKNASFSAGVLVGKDYLTKEDRLNDPTVNKLWISFWLGVSH